METRQVQQQSAEDEAASAGRQIDTVHRNSPLCSSVACLAVCAAMAERLNAQYSFCMLEAPTVPAPGSEDQPAPPTLGALALLFLRLGTTAFGGPAAHIAMMEDEVVRRRRWLRREQFLELLGAANLIPGPSSTELAIYIGGLLGGRVGLVLAGVCFILPAALLVALLAWAYVEFGKLPQVAGLLYGMKAAV